MQASILKKLESIAGRHEELEYLLVQPQVMNDQNQFRNYSREYAQLDDVVTVYRKFRQVHKDLDTAGEMLADPEMKDMAAQEIKEGKIRLQDLTLTLQKLLLSKDPHDDNNIFLEIRAGTGGNEAAIFAGDLFKMYNRYAETQLWQTEIINESPGEHGGYKEIIARVVGAGAYSRLKFESGAHRVQRVPETESQGRIHTSACTVAIMPELHAIEEFDINLNDLRIDTFRASGAGGQHVNKTDSAIRITHLPTGVVVECQEERSQHKNKARAMSLLQSRLLTAEQSKQTEEQAQTRRSLVGSGDRSERIRTYNYPQGRVTDHRINLTLYSLNEIMAGDLQQIIEPLISRDQAEQLAALATS